MRVRVLAPDHTASKWQGRDPDLGLPDVWTPFCQVHLPDSVGFQGQTRVAASLSLSGQGIVIL